MGLHQLEMRLLVPDASLLRFHFSYAEQPIFHLGLVHPSNIVFTSVLVQLANGCFHLNKFSFN